MDSNLNVVIWYICKSKLLHSIAVKYEDGLNNEPLMNAVKYYLEESHIGILTNDLPLHIKSHIDTIVRVDEIFDLVIVPSGA